MSKKAERTLEMHGNDWVRKASDVKAAKYSLTEPNLGQKLVCLCLCFLLSLYVLLENELLLSTFFLTE